MWIESHQSLGRHPKLFRLASKLNVHKAQAIGHLQYLWWWALDFSPTGNLSSFTNTQIAAGAEWDGDPDLFVVALNECGWIDPDRTIDDWRRICRENRREINRKSSHKRRARIALVENTLTTEEWREIVEYFGSRCAYCHQSVSTPILEHVIPIVRGGGNVANNVVPSCVNCNQRKHAKSMLEFTTGFCMRRGRWLI